MSNIYGKKQKRKVLSVIEVITSKTLTISQQSFLLFHPQANLHGNNVETFNNYGKNAVKRNDSACIPVT